MYRLMIVDDDEMLRKGMVQNIDWKRHDIEVVAEAVNGKDALCKVNEFMPQIIVTDIQMPIMDGLQLAETVSSLYPQIKIILLTAYEEFEYAKRAFEYGVAQYVLKYESQDTILQAVLRASRLIDAEAESRMLKGKNLDTQRRNFFREVSCNKTDISVIREQAEQLGIDISYNRYAMISFKIESIKEMDEISFLVQVKEDFHIIEETIGKRCRESGYEISFFQGKEYLNGVLMDTGRGAESISELLKNEITKLSKQMNIRLFAGMGRWYETIDYMYESYTEAIKINNLRDVLERDYPKEKYPILEYSPDMFAEETMEKLAEKVTRYINVSYAKADLSLEQIAAQVHLSGNYVSTLFKKYYGINISDYIIKVRMEHAASLLSATNFKTYEVAEQVGYANSQYFSVLFKKFYKITPKEYRNQYKK